MLSERLQTFGNNVFSECPSLDCLNFPAVINRAKSLLDTDRTGLKDMLEDIEGFEWRGDKAVASLGSISVDNWATTRGIMDTALPWIKYFEMREATTIFELALWKAKIEESGTKWSYGCSWTSKRCHFAIL